MASNPPIEAPIPLPHAARALNMSKATLTKYVQRGQVRGVRLGRRWLIPAAELRRIAGTPAGVQP